MWLTRSGSVEQSWLLVVMAMVYQVPSLRPCHVIVLGSELATVALGVLPAGEMPSSHSSYTCDWFQVMVISVSL